VPVADLIRACEIGAEVGLKFVYAGNLPGRVGRGDRWAATFVSPPSGGLDFRAFLDPAAAEAAAGAIVIVTSPRLPDGQGPGQAWLTTDRTAWRARSVYLWRPAVAVPGEPAPLW